jgi:hypothetical protein
VSGDRDRARGLLSSLGLSWPVETELSVAAVFAEVRDEGRREGLNAAADRLELWASALRAVER